MTLEEIRNIIQTQNAVSIYFSGENCNVCKALQPKIKDMFNNSFPKVEQYYFDIDEYREIAVYFNVFSMPTILVFLDGKEFIRKSRNLSVSEFAKDFQRPYSLFFD